jgi:small-conductance mechanosensitive channel
MAVAAFPTVVAQTAVDLDTLDKALGGGGLSAWDWAGAAIIFAGAVVASQLLRLAVDRVVGRRAEPAVADLFARLASYIAMVLGLIYALEQLGVQVGPLLGALGVIGIAVAFALKDILENFVAGLLLQFRRPFSYGDQIVSGDIEGTVQSIDARSVTVITPDGETVHIPSSRVITEAIINHTARGSRRTTLEVGVAYGTDVRAAQATLLGAVGSVDGVMAEPPPEVLVEAFGESSIDLVVRVWHAPTIAQQWSTRSAVALAVLDACRSNAIEIPFPQRVIRRPPGDPTGG